jgi:hypothetical protein
LLNATNKEFKLLEDLLQHLHILVVHRLMEQVVKTESASDHEHQALVELGRYLEQRLVVVLQLQAIILDVVDHARLLLVEKLPHFEHVFEVVPRHLVEVPLLGGQLLLVLLLQNLEVEVKEPLDFWGVFRLKRIYVRE